MLQILFRVLLVWLIFNPLLCFAEQVQVESFSPQGTVKGVRQVTARFSAAMIPFGDPRLPEPFDIDCSAKGTGRWADDRNWVYDFDRDLPAGKICRFTLKPSLKSLAGEQVKADSAFLFNTGGPSVLRVLPYEGETIDDRQIFILGLDAPVNSASVLDHAWCTAEGINEKIGVQLIEGADRDKILAANQQSLGGVLNVLIKSRDHIDFASFNVKERGTPFQQAIKANAQSIVLVQCKRSLPAKANISLVWGSEVLSASGVATDADQPLAFLVRQHFRAKFECQRVNKRANCIPMLPMTLQFTAPVPRRLAEKITLTESNKTLWHAKLDNDNSDTVGAVSFSGPFPEHAVFMLALPDTLRDDAGRLLYNRARFPLQVKTDEAPPLVKFPADFGIIELNAGAVLPVTVRNLDKKLDKKLAASSASTMNGIPGRSLTVDDTPDDILLWLGKMKANNRDKWAYDTATHRSVPTVRSGDHSVFTAGDGSVPFRLPKPNGAKAFEIIGIPLQHPGLHIIELASPRLGVSLLGEKKPYFVRTAALVTNLAVHFKQGRESSLVWVTSLDKARPVANAAVSVRDCNGTQYWQGKTDTDGIARIEQVLPRLDQLPICFGDGIRSYFVTARSGKDNSFVFSDWNEGINRWRFNLPKGSHDGSIVATTVFDRTLLRAGETVHMKLYYRRQTRSGFVLPDISTLPVTLTITHEGMEQKYELPLKWNPDGTAESVWSIPKDAKQGAYDVSLNEAAQGDIPAFQRDTGTFNVEDFRVPIMKAILKPLNTPMINVASAQMDIQLNYLSGGGADGLAVKLRGLVEPYSVDMTDYPDFTFANGRVTEGLQADTTNAWQFNGNAGDDGGDDEQDDAPVYAPTASNHPLGAHMLQLDKSGAIRATLDKLPRSDAPQQVTAELEYSDPNGEILTSSSHFTVWPSRILLGLKPDAWAASKEHLKFHVLALDTDGKPLDNVPVVVELLQKQNYSHRKRLIGGFYAYENKTEIKLLGTVCQENTDAKGYVHCETHSDTDGDLILQAHATDSAGNISWVHTDIWVAGKDDWWFDTSNDDRMDVLPEKTRYEPGDTATFQVRMPFRAATALVSVEREGVLDAFVVPVSGKDAVVHVPIKSNYAPNVFVSVLAVRPRVDAVQPGALVDLGKPAFKLGIGQIKVGWRAHELKVDVHADKDHYTVRSVAHVHIKVVRADGGPLPKGAEVALAAVDEGLLELMPNLSWNLLDTMMSPRGLEVDTSTAQMQVVGKRHFGLKSVPSGGGGGRQAARELFETLLKWQGRVMLDVNSEAQVDIPLNDSLTSFRIVAIAHAGAGLFGTGTTTLTSTQDVMLLSGVPPLVRESDTFRAVFTVRNASNRHLSLQVIAHLSQGSTHGVLRAVPGHLEPQTVELEPGAAQEVSWRVTAPLDADKLVWTVLARNNEGNAHDALKISQQVIPAIPVRTYQATIVQLDKPWAMTVAQPSDALPNRGGVLMHLQSRLADELAGVQDYMASYPYDCLEQQVSQAVALHDQQRWKGVMSELPAYLDSDGMAKYFPMLYEGSDTLTAYILAVADEAGWTIPETSRQSMIKALNGFVAGHVIRYSALPTADLSIRKLAALDALARYQPIDDDMTQSFTIEPNLWPTSAVLDWYDVLKHSPALNDRARHMQQAQQIIRSRLNFQGTTMGFSTERSDYLWWLMISGDVNANRVILDMLDDPAWQADMPRLVRGSVGRQHAGRWNTTVANAWGVLALEKFSQRFESIPVTGHTVATLQGEPAKTFAWDADTHGGQLFFNWPSQPSKLQVTQAGTGKPWLTVESRAAIPLQHAISSGFHINRTVTAIEQKVKGQWARGDVIRVHLDLEAQSDMSWVVVDDPIPAGSTLLGNGLGRDSKSLVQGEIKRGWVWPAFEERTFAAYRAYYTFVPKGTWHVEYTVRLNNAGQFTLPATRVEAMYAPEMFGETPNQSMLIH